MKILDQVPRYQKDVNVKKKKVTKEYGVIFKILQLLPKTVKLYDIACAEGFICWLAKKAGIVNAKGIEIDADRVERGKKYLGVDVVTGDIFENIDKLNYSDVYVFSRFFHNIGEESSRVLMDKLDKKKHFMLIIKYKPGLKKENGQKREPLAIKDGLNKFLESYGLKKKSFPQQVIVAAKGKYVEYLPILRKHIGEG